MRTGATLSDAHIAADRHWGASDLIRTTCAANRGTGAGRAKRTPNGWGSSLVATAHCLISTACLRNAAGSRSATMGARPRHLEWLAEGDGRWIARASRSAGGKYQISRG